MQLCEPLLALVALELGPKLEVLIQHGQRLLVVFGQADLLPELLGQVGPLDRLHVQIAVAFVLEHGRVPRVRQRARVPRAQTRQVVLVPAESLLHCPAHTQEPMNA